MIGEKGGTNRIVPLYGAVHLVLLPVDELGAHLTPLFDALPPGIKPKETGK